MKRKGTLQVCETHTIDFNAVGDRYLNDDSKLLQVPYRRDEKKKELCRC